MKFFVDSRAYEECTQMHYVFSVRGAVLESGRSSHVESAQHYRGRSPSPCKACVAETGRQRQSRLVERHNRSVGLSKGFSSWDRRYVEPLSKERKVVLASPEQDAQRLAVPLELGRPGKQVKFLPSSLFPSQDPIDRLFWDARENRGG